MPLLPAVLAAIALSAGATHPAEAQTGTSEACQRLANNSGFRGFDLLYPLIGSRCFAEAETLARRMLEENERLNSQDPYEMARRYHLLGNLATIYLEMHRYAEAEPLARRALQGWEQARPSPTLVPAALSDLRLQAADRLARIYLARRRFAEALPLAQRVLAARERASGREHRDTLYYLEGLAETYEGLGRYPEAEPLRRRVLVARERALVQQRCAPLGSITTTALTRIDDCHNLHHDTLAAMNNLARLYGILGRYAEAVPLMRRTLDAHERLSGSEGATTMIAVNNMAVLLIAQGRSAEAEPLLRRLLDVRERRLGPDAPDTLIAVNNLAVALQEQRRFPEAETLFRRVLAAREGLLGAQHAETQAARANLATLSRLARPAVQTGSPPAAAAAAAPGQTCMIVTDVIIVEGEEVSAVRQLCRTPPSSRWVRMSSSV